MINTQTTYHPRVSSSSSVEVLFKLPSSYVEVQLKLQGILTSRLQISTSLLSSHRRGHPSPNRRELKWEPKKNTYSTKKNKKKRKHSFNKTTTAKTNTSKTFSERNSSHGQKWTKNMCQNLQTTHPMQPRTHQQKRPRSAQNPNKIQCSREPAAIPQKTTVPANVRKLAQLQSLPRQQNHHLKCHPESEL